MSSCLPTTRPVLGRAGISEWFSQAQQLGHWVQILLGIFSAKGVLPLEFKPAHSVGDLLTQHLDELKWEAESKGGYFFHQLGWLDLLGSLPFPGLRIARVFRVARVIRLVRAVGMKTLIDKILHDRAGSALYVVLVLCVVVIQYGAIFELVTNRTSPDANITTASDAVWYVIVTITTVGYGDKYPVTNPGRIVGVLIMVVGVGLFGVLTGFLANAFLAPKDEKPQEKGAEQPGGQPSGQPAPEPAPLPASVGLTAKIDQLSAEVASLRLLIERLPATALTNPQTVEPPSSNHLEDPTQDTQA